MLNLIAHSNIYLCYLFQVMSWHRIISNVMNIVLFPPLRHHKTIQTKLSCARIYLDSLFPSPNDSHTCGSSGTA